MPNLTPQEQQELQDFIRENFSQKELENLAALGEFISRFDAQSLKEAMQKLAKALNSIDTNDFNEKLTDLLMQTWKQQKAKNQQEVTTEKRPAVEKKPVIFSHSHKPKSIRIEVSKIGKELRNAQNRPDYYDKDESGALMGGEVRTGETSEKGKKGRYEVKPIHSILMLEYDAEKLKKKGIDVPAFAYLTTFDLEVLTICITLLKEGNEYVSAEMIYRLMNGGANKRLTPAMRERIYNALRRLDCSRMYIDATQEFEAGKNTMRHYEGALLPNEFLYDVNISLNGTIIRDAIHFFRNSPLYDYSEAKKQVTSFPAAMLDVPAINGTEQNILLTLYLARFIVEASNDNNDLKPIRHYSLIYAYLGVEARNATITARIRTVTRAILSEWVKRGFIKGFQELTEDNKPAKQGAKVAKIRVELLSKKELQALKANSI